MKKICVITLSILIISGLFASCAGQTDTLTPNRLIYEDKIGQYVSIQEFAYAGSKIPISAKFIKELDFVNYGFKLEQTVSQNKPNGKKWLDELIITENDIGSAYDVRNQIRRKHDRMDDCGEYEIAVTGVPKDGSGALTIYGKINIVQPPQISLDFNNRLFEESQTFMVVSDKPLDLVRITDQYGTRHTLKTKDKFTFKTELTLHDKSFGDLKLEAYDNYGFELNENVHVHDTEEIRICNFFVDFRVDGGDDVVGCVSYNTGGEDKRQDMLVNIPDHIDYEYRTQIMEHPSAIRQGIYLGSEMIPSSVRGVVMGASPNGKWIIYTYQEYINLMKDDDIKTCFKEDEYYIRDIQMFHFVLLNTLTGDVKRLSTRYKKTLITCDKDFDIMGRTHKESGEWYYVIKWTDDDEVYLLEQTKDDKLYAQGLQEQYDNMDIIESPHATARIVRFTPDDMTMHETSYEPPRAWVGYTDHQTGLTGYTSPTDDCIHSWGGKVGRLTESNYNSRALSIMSSMDGKNKHHMTDLDIPFIEEKGIYVSTTLNLSSGYLNGELYLIMGVLYVVNPREYEGDKEYFYEHPTKSPHPPITLIALNIDTGKVSVIGKLDEFSYKLLNHGNHFLPECRWANIDNRIYFFINTRDSDDGMISNTHLAYIDENLKFHKVSDIQSDIFDGLENRLPTYIRKGGWYND